MQLHFLPMNEQYARHLLTWRYEQPYGIYDMVSSNIESDLEFFIDPVNAYYAVIDQNHELIAYRCFGTDAQVPGGIYNAGALDTGGGLRPDLTGRGLGLTTLNAGLAFGRQLFAPHAFRVTVAAFNQRALRVVDRAGFQPTQRFIRQSNGQEYVILVKDEQP